LYGGGDIVIPGTGAEGGGDVPGTGRIS